MWELVSGGEIAILDKEVGIPSIVLMENAGSAVVEALRAHLGSATLASQRIAVLCGTGNNGADGLVIARKLRTTYSPENDAVGGKVHVLIVTPKGSKTDPVLFKSEEGRANYELIKRFGVSCQIVGAEDSMNDLFIDFDIVIDAVLGAGARRSTDDVHEFHWRLFTAVNMRRTHGNVKTVVAVDVPSGICPTRGISLYDDPIRADLTVTFGRVKSGLVLYPAVEYVGKLFLGTISFPLPSPEETPTLSLSLIPKVHHRLPYGHKGSFGKALFVSGSAAYYGAPMLSSLGFLKSGGGYSRLATSSEVARVVAVNAPEVVMVDDTGFEWAMSDSDVVVVGPGIGLGPDAVAKLDSVFRLWANRQPGRRSIVIDGDGLTILAQSTGDWMNRIVALVQAGVCVVLTPHIGEWKRLFDSTGLENQYDYIRATREFLCRYSSELGEHAENLVVVVKGARSGIVTSGSAKINVTGNAGMATCGSGDVLCGIIAAFLARHDWTRPPACVVADAVFVHGLAGDLHAKAHGQEGMIARDILHAIPNALKMVQTNEEELKQAYYPANI